MFCRLLPVRSTFAFSQSAGAYRTLFSSGRRSRFSLFSRHFRRRRGRKHRHLGCRRRIQHRHVRSCRRVQHRYLGCCIGSYCCHRRSPYLFFGIGMLMSVQSGAGSVVGAGTVSIPLFLSHIPISNADFNLTVRRWIRCERRYIGRRVRRSSRHIRVSTVPNVDLSPADVCPLQCRKRRHWWSISRFLCRLSRVRSPHSTRDRKAHDDGCSEPTSCLPSMGFVSPSPSSLLVWVSDSSVYSKRSHEINRGRREVILHTRCIVD